LVKSSICNGWIDLFELQSEFPSKFFQFSGQMLIKPSVFPWFFHLIHFPKDERRDPGHGFDGGWGFHGLGAKEDRGDYHLAIQHLW